MRYVKKPVEVEAWCWNGCEEMAGAIIEWMGGAGRHVAYDRLYNQHIAPELHITTLEDGVTGAAKHVASPGDYIIKGVNGEFYPCKPDIFHKTYDKVES